MDIKKNLQSKKIGKEKIALIAFAGILLVGSSYFGNIENESDNVLTEETVVTDNYQRTVNKEIRNLIENIKGISNVNVVISFESGGEKILQEDNESSFSENEGNNTKEKNGTVKSSTVILGQDGDEVPYVVKEIYPKISGIAVTAKGVSDANKKEEIINMLSALFNVPIHNISIIDIG